MHTRATAPAANAKIRRETVKPPEQNKADFNAFGQIETGLRLYFAQIFSVLAEWATGKSAGCF
ncbi:hypothetical protein HMPREF9098_0603 [Kingella denitrificans ATCC 33394]|uniref:Uncharacterized protein n=1 Tax=Kingella denitrificans ATCC 33394 TaxID=888741 RepID=F0EXL9_9NEIS|nr:hypothetical protein HMPREF9098_0603 [Kingella denitrificans ATCC 33394]